MFFFAPLIAMPYYTLVLVYVLAAVLPAVFLMRYVYRQDRIEANRPICWGSWRCWEWRPRWFPWCRKCWPNRCWNWVGWAGIPGMWCCWRFWAWARWRRARSSSSFTGAPGGTETLIIVMTPSCTPGSVLLGFAAFENVKYIFNYGLSVAFTRAILAIPGHMSFAVFMGVFYGRAKLRYDCGNSMASRVNLLLGYLAAVMRFTAFTTPAA